MSSPLISTLLLWPYDELKTVVDEAESKITFNTPWLSVFAKLDPLDLQKAKIVSEKITAQTLTPQDVLQLAWLLRPVAKYPFAYFLPRPRDVSEWPGPIDTPALKDTTYLNLTPLEFLRSGLQESLAPAGAYAVNEHPLFQSSPGSWTWDLETSLQFSQTKNGFDPLSLLSLSRRYHLIDTLSLSKSGDLFRLTESFKGSPERFKRASSLMVRQNHYVTQKCDESLRPALNIAYQASAAVQSFIESEKGHDILLGRAVESMGFDAESVEVMASTQALMSFLKLVASRNLLAFAMAVDIFERSSYSEQDPLAALLEKGGYASAARAIDVHKNINDSGDHENVSLSFLEHLGPVPKEVAIEALRFSEIITILSNLITRDVLEKVTNSV